MGIKLDYASVYHPQTNGQVEHANGLIMSGIKPRLVRSLQNWTRTRSRSSTPYSGGCGPRRIVPPDIHHFYGVRRKSSTTCDIIHDSPRVRMYKEKEAELDRQDNLDALEEERDVAKARSAFYQQQLAKTEKYGPKLITLANSFYAYQRKRRTSSSPSGRVPSSLIILTGGAYRLRNASDNKLEPNPWARLRRFYA